MLRLGRLEKKRKLDALDVQPRREPLSSSNLYSLAELAKEAMDMKEIGQNSELLQPDSEMDVDFDEGNGDQTLLNKSVANSPWISSRRIFSLVAGDTEESLPHPCHGILSPSFGIRCLPPGVDQRTVEYAHKAAGNRK